MRIACILAPHLPVQVERNRDPGLTGRPIIVGGQPWDPGVVLDCCPAGEADGVRPGIRLARAEVLCPTARFLPADEPAYRAAHQALEAAIRQLTDRIETAGLGLFFADVTGLERTHGSDSHLARRLALEVGGAPGHFPPLTSVAKPDVRVGMASDRFTAEQAARAARPSTGSGEASDRWCLVPPGEERSFLSSLPLPTLPIDPEPLRRLNLLGVHTLGALAALPRLALSRQFGPQAGFLHDLASGRDPRPVYTEAPPLGLEGRHAFEPPVAERGPRTAQAGRIVSALAADRSRRGSPAWISAR